jgi:hypothetical protein
MNGKCRGSDVATSLSRSMGLKKSGDDTHELDRGKLLNQHLDSTALHHVLSSAGVVPQVLTCTRR